MLIYYTTISRPTNDYIYQYVKTNYANTSKSYFCHYTRVLNWVGTLNLVTFFSTRSFYSVTFYLFPTIFWPCFVLLLCCQE